MVKPILELSTTPLPPIGVTLDGTFYRLRRPHELGVREIKALDAATPQLARLLAQDELSPAEAATVDGLVQRVCAIAVGPDADAVRALARLTPMQRMQVAIAYRRALELAVPASASPDRRPAAAPPRRRAKGTR